jgi:hypothetical protein
VARGSHRALTLCQDHRYGSDWLVSGKRQYNDAQKGFQYKRHDPLKTQSNFDTVEKTGYKLGGALEQTRFHRGFQRRRVQDIDPYKHRCVNRRRSCSCHSAVAGLTAHTRRTRPRLQHDDDIAQRTREYAPIRREYLASQIWRNGKDPISAGFPGADCNPRHATA